MAPPVMPPPQPARCSRLPLWLLALAALVAGAAGPVSALPSDDFDDNHLDPAKWGPFSRLGNGTLTERNQRLEYTCNSPGGEDLAVQPWVLTRMPCGADWEAQVDLTNTTNPGADFQVCSFGINIVSPFSPDSELEVEMYCSSLAGGGARTGFYAAVVTGGTLLAAPDSGAFDLMTQGAVRMQYTAATRVITVFYDTNPADDYQWVPFGTFGLAGAGGADANTDWGLSDTDQFPIRLYGYSVGMVITSGQMFGDNFQETGGVPPNSAPWPDPIGNFTFTFPTSNPLLIAIFNLTGSYRGVAPFTANRSFTLDAAQDESGKLAIMGTMDGLRDADGNTDITGGTGAVSTVGGAAAATVKAGGGGGTLDGASATISGQGSGPVEVIDAGGGTPGFGGTGSLKSTVGGVPMTLKNEPLQVPAEADNLDNLQKGWSLELSLRRAVVKGKEVTVGSARLALPGGDVIEFPERAVKYSASKGYSLSFKKGTNATAIPPRTDKKSSVTIKGLTFERHGDEWLPTGGVVTYQFLGQKGTANLMDFTVP